MIRLIDLPGVAEIEARVRLNATARIKGDDWDLARKVSALTEDVFGIKGSPASVRMAYFTDEYFRLGAEAYDAKYFAPTDEESDDLSDIEAYLAEGWDIRDANGQELLCFELIEDAVQCVEDGIAGRTKTELEAMIWSARKAPTPKKPSQEDQRRNQAFLDLGQRRRRRA